MKLYTEREITESLESMGLELMVNDFFQMSEPIELPSDEEIGKEMDKLPFSKHVDDGLFNDGQLMGFELGAKWMKEQILGKEDKTFKQKSKWTEVDNMTRRLK